MTGTRQTTGPVDAPLLAQLDEQDASVGGDHHVGLVERARVEHVPVEGQDVLVVRALHAALVFGCDGDEDLVRQVAHGESLSARQRVQRRYLRVDAAGHEMKILELRGTAPGGGR